ncbi:MAG: protein kinase [Candidatus Microthrix parvicella]
MELIGRYTTLREFTTVGGGQSEWTLALSEGREVFIKRYLQPVVPDPTLGLSGATMQRLHDRVEYFRARQLSIIGRLDHDQVRHNVIGSLDFFEHQRRFYKVTTLVSEVQTLPLVGQPVSDVAAVLFGAVTAIEYLHDRSIVHGDIKPDNFLLSRDPDGGLKASLIDLDEAYVQGYAPSQEDIVGTIGYYSPELGDYVSGRVPGSALTTASDMFSLGLTLVEMLTGQVPVFDRGAFRTAAHALANGALLDLSACGSSLAQLLGSMLTLDPAARPSASEVLDRIGNLDLDRLLDGAQVSTRVDQPKRPRGQTFLDLAAPRSAADEEEPGLLINLGRPGDRVHR